MNSFILSGLSNERWGGFLSGIRNSEENGNNSSSQGLLISSETSFQVKVLNSRKKVEFLYDLSDILEVSKKILDVNLENGSKKNIDDIIKGLEHLEGQLRQSIARHELQGKPSFFSAVDFYEDVKNIAEKKYQAEQILVKKKLFNIAKQEVLSSQDILFIENLVDKNYTLLFNLTQYGESFFDLTKLKCKREDIFPLIKNILQNVEQLNKDQIKNFKDLLFKFESTDSLFFNWLMDREEANQIFEALLKISTDEELNQDVQRRSLILGFAYSRKRYEYVFLNIHHLSREVLNAADQCYQAAKLNFSVSIQSEYARKNLAKYNTWLLKRSSSSTTVASEGSKASSHERWIKAENRRTTLCSKQFFSWSEAKKMHIDLCEGEEGIKSPGQLRTTVVRTSGGWTHLFCPPKDLHDNVNQLLEWLNSGLLACEQNQLNPIVFATQTYQRFVSLHPFENGNGRFSRLMMDYVLERNHLPPPILGNDVNVAVFPLDTRRIDQVELIQKIIKGIELSRKELSGF